MQIVAEEKIDKYAILFILIVSLAAVTFWYEGVGAGATNEQIPMVFRLADSSYLVNDWFVNYNDSFTNVRYCFNYFIMLVNKIFNDIAITYILVYFICIFFSGIAAYKTSAILFKNKNIAKLTVLFSLLGASFALGGTFLISFILVPMLVAAVFSWWSLYFLIKEKYNLFAIFSGLSFLFHITWGAFVFSALLIASLLNSFIKKEKIFKVYLIPLLIFGIFIMASLPTIIPQFESNNILTASEVLHIEGVLRHPFHYVPSTWEWQKYAEFFMFLTLSIMSFLSLSKQIRKREKVILSTTVLIIIFYFLIGVVFVELIPIKNIIHLQMFRASPFITYIGYLFISAWIYLNIKNTPNKIRKIFFVLLGMSLIHSHFLLLFFPAFIIYLYFSKNSSVPQPRIRRIFRSKFLFVSLIFYVLITALIILLYFEPISTWILAKVQVLYSVILKTTFAMLATLSIIIKNKKICRHILFIALLLCIITLFFKPSVLYYPLDLDKQELYNFIRESTPSTAIFLSYPVDVDFRFMTNRADIVDFNFPFNEEGMKEWYSKLNDITKNKAQLVKKGRNNLFPITEGYENLSEEDLFFLNRKYNISYAVFNNPKNLSLPIVFKNKKYVVYKIKG